MEIAEFKPHVSSDGRTVNFVLSSRGREIECAITCEALHQYFWLQSDAAEACVLRTFEDGRKRITAMAERKLLGRPDGRVLLTASDFAIRA
ncbi:DUF1488 family protein [Paraburkholderia sp.]|uniref:DUF1488 family protein n=1 Tax=Paraburkholderia sp. TaxID=1926495 RepID=UPI00238B21CF|nr:DUF1488 family protein [Paraburkholderia sp.]MDE1179293.1 DUF1488 family protein [Paraburkholderia sp.]